MGSHMILLKTTIIYFSRSFDQLVFLIETLYVFYEVGAEILNIFKKSFMFSGFTKRKFIQD
jgi:hypothetical protein